MTKNTQQRFLLWGWILFIFSALFFMASSIRAADPVSLAGGTLFLVACFVFLVPLLFEMREQRASNSSPRHRYSRYPRGWFHAASSQWRVPVATTMPPVPAHLQEQSRRHSIRSELRFFASTR